MTGTIFDIQRMSLHDGPGIRTTVFFKGCSMHCFWCHNPESLSVEPDIQFFADRCILCGRCQEVCDRYCHSIDQKTRVHDFKRDSCTKCGKCAQACAAGSLIKTGEVITPEELVKIVIRDRVFFEHSGGGVTASGGEPLLQSAFVQRFFAILKQQGIHTAVETALNVSPESLTAVIPFTDLFLADIKHPDPDRHRSATGVTNELITRNFRILEQSGRPYVIRVPVVPGVNDSEAVMRALNTRICSLLHPLYLELMPYHEYGLKKYSSLSREHSALDALHPPSKDTLVRLAKCFDTVKVIFRDGAKTVTVSGGVLCEKEEP